MKEIPEILNGAHADEYLNNAWMELGDIRRYRLVNPMLHAKWNNEQKTPENIVETCRDPKYLHFFTKYVLNLDLLPYQTVILDTFWHKPLPMIIGSRGSAKSFMLAVYLICRSIIQQGCKCVVVGAAFRQSLVIWNYIFQIWDNAPILRDICGGKNFGPRKDIHKAYWRAGSSECIFLPLGSGDKIRGIRGNVVVADEFSSIPVDIFETVVRGFAAVKSEGVHNNVIKAYKQEIADKYGFSDALDDKDYDDSHNTLMKNNQIIIAGSAYFQFNPFYKYYKQYRAIIQSGGNKEKFKEMCPDVKIDEEINPKDYAIIRIPYAALPKGMMDETILQQGRATMDRMIYDMEYNTIFPSDSEGFYLASILEAATCPVTKNGKEIIFPAKLYGHKDRLSVMGIDPASENDNFTINIIEIQDDSVGGIVYQWKTNRKEYEKLRNDKVLDEDIQDYNTFCVRQVRTLRRRFNIAMIVMDASGGGISLKEGLRDPSKLLNSSDDIILDMDDELIKNVEGLKILKMIEFSNAGWRREAHYGLRKDLMDKNLLFPFYDSAGIEEEIVNNSKNGNFFDTLDQCYLEILECKNETMMIRHSITQGGTERWDVPDIKGIDSNQVSKTLKRDRFSSLLLANWGRRLIIHDQTVAKPVEPEFMLAISRKGGQTNNAVTFMQTDAGNGRKICF